MLSLNYFYVQNDLTTDGSHGQSFPNIQKSTVLTTDLTVSKNQCFLFLCYTLAALNGEQYFWVIVLVTPNDSSDSKCQGGLIKYQAFLLGELI